MLAIDAMAVLTPIGTLPLTECLSWGRPARTYSDGWKCIFLI